VWFVTGIPTLVMYTMSIWALVEMTLPRFYNRATGSLSLPADPVPWAGVILIALAAVMLVEAIRAVMSSPASPSGMQPALA
jgi:carbon starvation protein